MRIIPGASGARFRRSGPYLVKEGGPRLFGQAILQQARHDDWPGPPGFRPARVVRVVPGSAGGHWELWMPFYRDLQHPVHWLLHAPVPRAARAARAVAALIPRGTFSEDSTRACVALQERTAIVPTVPAALRGDVQNWFQQSERLRSGWYRGLTLHGDLTWSNVLWSSAPETTPHRLIDFTDSFLYTPLVDAGKLYMDAVLGWSVSRHLPPGAPPGQWQWLWRHQLQELHSRFSDPIAWAWVRALGVHFILRLWPYHPEHRLFLADHLSFQLTHALDADAPDGAEHALSAHATEMATDVPGPGGPPVV